MRSINNDVSKINETGALTPQSRNTGELGKDDFMKLLITQLRYQDPMSPMDNTAFIAQLAQFSSLESMRNMQTSFEGAKAYSLIGRNILSTDPDSLAQNEGKVSAVKLASGKYTLVLAKTSSDANTVLKADAMQAFSGASMSYLVNAPALFTPESLNSDTLTWKSSINSLDNLAQALGFSNASQVPLSISSMWAKSSTIEIPQEHVTYVF